MKIGADRFAEELIKIGFEERIPFEYGLYSSTVSTTETFTSELQLADSGFRQGEILTNPIHLAAVYSIGQQYKLYIYTGLYYGAMIQPRIPYYPR